MTLLWQRPARSAATAWSRPRLTALVVGVALIGFALLIGLGLFVRSAIYAATEPATMPGAVQHPDRQDSKQSRVVRRNALAAAPMLVVSAEDARSGEPAVKPSPGIAVPSATRIGAARVPTAFPHTPEGAVGQLAAVEVAVLQPMSVARAVEVYRAWVDPGAGPVEQWPLMVDVRAFLGAARVGSEKDLASTVTVSPVAAQVKATDGPDWTVACVLVDVRAVIATESRMAYGYCERMQWSGDRWTIASGNSPAPAPSTWPGTTLAAEAGWRTWPDE